MSDQKSDQKLVEQIRHYQKDIDKNPENAERMKRCIQRLYILPVMVEHLQETGVGKSVNSLRKYNGEIGNMAKALVSKWKSMVAAEEANVEIPPEAQVAKSIASPSMSNNSDKKSKEKNHNSKSHESPKRDNGSKKKCKKFERKKRDRSSSRESIDENDTDSDHHRDDHHSSHHHRKDKKSSKRHSSIPIENLIKENEKKVKKENDVSLKRSDDGSIDCGSGASFADALLVVDAMVSKKKKKKIKDEKSPDPSFIEPKASTSSSKTTIKIKKENTFDIFKEPDLLSRPIKSEPLELDLPEININYKPLPHIPESFRKTNMKATSEEETMSSLMTTKHLRTKVFSGGKVGAQTVPTLFSLCIQILYENIDSLEYTGGVPYDLLKPLLHRLNAYQLYSLEHHNPYLIEDTDSLWKFHCRKDFRNKALEEMESWRELYLRCVDEREKKLSSIRANINESIAKSTPVRTAKLAYVDSVVKPPRNIAKKQAKYGTGSSPKLGVDPEKKKEILSKAIVGGHTPGMEATTVVPPPRHSIPNSAPGGSFIKKKKAPLMQKALALIKGNRFKR